MPTDIFTATAVPGRSAALDVCVASSVANSPTTGMKSWICVPLAFTVVLLCGQRTDHRTRMPLGRFSTQQTWLPVGTGSRCRRIPQREQLFAGIIDRALHLWRHVPALDGVPCDHDLDDSETDTMTLSPKRATRMNLCRKQVSGSPVCPSANGGVVGWRWLSHAMGRTRSVSGQYLSSTISTSRTVSRTTGSEGHMCLTFWRWRMTSFSGVSQRSRPPQRWRGKCAHLLRDLTVRSSLSNFWIWLTAGCQKLRGPTSTSTMSIPLRQCLIFALNCTPQDTLTRPHFSFQIPGSRPLSHRPSHDSRSCSWQVPASQRSASALDSDSP